MIGETWTRVYLTACMGILIKSFPVQLYTVIPDVPDLTPNRNRSMGLFCTSWNDRVVTSRNVLGFLVDVSAGASAEADRWLDPECHSFEFLFGDHAKTRGLVRNSILSCSMYIPVLFIHGQVE